jgi:cytochrome c oxidase subunit 3
MPAPTGRESISLSKPNPALEAVVPGAPPDAHPHPPGLAHHFEDLEQQLHSSVLGMWIFLVTEIMFFGGVFVGYAIYRGAAPDAFAAASGHLDITLGGFNTVVLICSSLTMALAVREAQLGKNRGVFNYLLATLALGTVFLVVKAFEYHDKWTHHLIPGPSFQWPDAATARGAEMFYCFYFALTGIHAAHMIIGAGLLIYFLMQARKNRYHSQYYGPVENMGLYWHFVDIIWIFLFPLLYLLGLHLSGSH